MKSVTLLFKSILPIVLAVLSMNAVYAQKALPVCSGVGSGYVYYVDATTSDIYKMNPASPGAAAPTGITLPSSSSTGLAVSANLSGTGPSPTYYTVVPVGIYNYLHYWNGSTWVNTGHTMNANNIGAGGLAIYGLDCVNGFVYKYTGSGSATYMMSIGNTSSCDIAADCAGNFYIINQIASPAYMRKYNSSGTLLTTYSLAGTYNAGNGGLAINGNTVYYDGADGKLYTGTISGTTVTFVATSTAPFATNGMSDFASCGFAGLGNTTGGKDTLKFCANANNVPFSASGPGPYNWTVISGPGKITGTGQTVTVFADTTTTIVNLNAGCDGTNTVPDTTVFYIARAKIDAGPDHSVIGCHGFFEDTLHGTLTDTSSDILFDIQWSPLGTIVSGDKGLDPIVEPKVSITYIMTVSTITGCKFVDSVRVTVIDSTPKPNFTWIPQLGCNQDTVRFINQSTGFIDSVHWDFGDTTGSNDISPTHIYLRQDAFAVWLYASNKYCSDSVKKIVNIFHPNEPNFIVSDSTICSNTLIKFTNKSKYVGNPTFLYLFGDGATSDLANPTHNYTQAGIYVAKLVLTNYLGCVDTAYKTIVVDSIPYANITTADTNICEGQAVNLIASYRADGNTGYSINLGDGAIFTNTPAIRYAFAQAGTYNVTLTATYRICDDAVYNIPIFVRPFPGVNIGSDTVLCPNGSPIVLTDRVNNNNPAAKYLWNTGETTPSIRAKDIGTYWARVTLDGCSGVDSLVVNKDCYIDIPNTFSPNGDGNNDYFLPRQFLSRSLNSFKMSIFNRWGQIIYESSTLNGRGWDGKFNSKDQPQGVYVYVIDVTFDSGVKEHYTGNVTLLR